MAIDTSPQGEFAAAVYQAVAAVPAGSVASYGEIAKRAGYPGYARHVGKLMSHLPPGSRLPWHRIIRADNSLPVGEPQAQLLEDEGFALNPQRTSVRRRRTASDVRHPTSDR